MTRSRARRSDVAADLTTSSLVAARPLNVAVTGAASSLGAEVVRALAAHPALGAVVAIDSTATAATRHTAKPGDKPTAVSASASVAWRTADVRHPSFAHALDGADVVVHTAIAQSTDAIAAERRAGNVEGMRTVLEAAAFAGVRRLVVVSSAMVYGALPDNPPLLSETDEVRAASDDSTVGDFVLVEELVSEFAQEHPDIATAVLRPVTIVGPGCDSVLTRHFETSRLLAIRGVVAQWQFVHVQDVASACVLAAIGAVEGVVNVAPPATLDQSDLEAITGSRRIELPASVVFGAADRLHRAGVTLAPAGEISYLAYPWAVDSLRLLEAGWRPAFDSAAALREHLALARSPEGARRLGRDDATRAAAGATVALLGTAALLRRARRRRP